MYEAACDMHVIPNRAFAELHYWLRLVDTNRALLTVACKHNHLCIRHSFIPPLLHLCRSWQNQLMAMALLSWQKRLCSFRRTAAILMVLGQIKIFSRALCDMKYMSHVRQLIYVSDVVWQTTPQKQVHWVVCIRQIKQTGVLDHSCQHATAQSQEDHDSHQSNPWNAKLQPLLIDTWWLQECAMHVVQGCSTACS